MSDQKTEAAAGSGYAGPACSALASILDERRRQTAKWGEQNHTLGNWGLILGEEYGEWCEAALHTQFGGPKAAGLRAEAVQVAAVALQIVQWLDRQNTPGQGPAAKGDSNG